MEDMCDKINIGLHIRTAKPISLNYSMPTDNLGGLITISAYKFDIYNSIFGS